MSTAASTARARSSRPTSTAPSRCSRPRARYWSALRGDAKAAFRFHHVSAPTRSTASLAPDDAAFTETHPYEPNSPYSASKAASDHLVRAWHHTYGLPVLTTNCSQQLRALPLPGEADPADDRQRAGRQAAAGLRRRPAGARLALRRATTAARSARVLARGRVGETYNIGGWNEKPNIEIVHTHLRAARRAAARPGRPATRA